MTHHILVGRSSTPTGKHYSQAGAVSAEQPNTWISGVVHAFETLDELAAILGAVANDPHSIVIPNAVLGVPVGEPILIGTLSDVATYRGMPNDGVWEMVRRAGPLKTQTGQWVIARNLEAFAPANIFVLDRDVKPDTPAEFGLGMDFDAWRRSVGRIIPGADTCDCIVMPSSSARIYDTVTGQALSSKSGHVWVLCDEHFDAGLEPRGKGSKLATRVKAAAMRSGQCWVKETAEGKRILQMPLDISVAIKGRWMFSGAPSADHPYAVAPAQPKLIRGNRPTISLGQIPDATEAEFRSLNERYGTNLGVAGDYQLSMDTLIETRDYGQLTIANLHDLYLSGSLGAAEDIKIRCQAAFRPESRSWNGILRLVKAEHSDDLQWLHHDQGEAQNSWLNEDGMRTINPGWNPEKFRTDFLLHKLEGVQWHTVGSATPLNVIDRSPGVVTPAAGEVAPMPGPMHLAQPVVPDHALNAWVDATIARLAQRCSPLGLPDIHSVVDREAIATAWRTSIVADNSGRWFILLPTGRIAQFSGEESRIRFFDKIVGNLGASPVRFGALQALVGGMREQIKALSNTPGQPTFDELPAAKRPKDASEWADMRMEQIINDVVGAFSGGLWEEIRVNRQVSGMNIDISPFCDQAHFEIDRNGEAIYHAPWDFLSVKNPQPQHLVEQVMADYRNHFPEIDTMLRWIAACRFSDHGRQSFGWLHAPGGWGKGLFVSALEELNVVFSMSVDDIVKATKGDPVGTDPMHIARAHLIFIDEWRHLKGELKLLNRSITASAKGRMRQTVRIFAKLFASAEMVPAFGDGVGIEKQFADRFSLFKGAGFIETRQLFVQLGTMTYRDCLAQFICNTLNDHYRHYIALGREGSSRESDAVLREINAASSIGREFGDLSETVSEVAGRFRKWIIEYATDPIRKKSHPKLDPLLTPDKLQHGTIFTDEGAFKAVRVGRATQLFKVWHEVIEGEAITGQLERKINAILEEVFESTGGDHDGKLRRMFQPIGGEKARLRGNYVILKDG